MPLKSKDTKVKNHDDEDDDLDVPEFDFDQALPNKFAERYAEGVAYEIMGADGVKRTFVQLDPDLARQFSSPKSVNDTLRRAIESAGEEAGQQAL